MVGEFIFGIGMFTIEFTVGGRCGCDLSFNPGGEVIGGGEHDINVISFGAKGCLCIVV